jgi:hypothetical protein
MGKLLDDVTRCDGTKHVRFECCDECLRRIAPRPEYVWMMDAPRFVNAECPSQILTHNVELSGN